MLKLCNRAFTGCQLIREHLALIVQLAHAAAKLADKGFRFLICHRLWYLSTSRRWMPEEDASPQSFAASAHRVFLHQLGVAHRIRHILHGLLRLERAIYATGAKECIQLAEQTDDLNKFHICDCHICNPSFRRSGELRTVLQGGNRPLPLISHADKHPTDLLSRNLIADAFDDMRNIINLVLCEKHKAEHHNTRVRRKTKILQAAAILQLLCRILNEGKILLKFPAIGRCIQLLYHLGGTGRFNQQFKLTPAQPADRANHHRARISSGERPPIA